MKHEHDPKAIESRTDEYVRTADPGGGSPAMHRELMRHKVIRELDAEADARIAAELGISVAALHEAARRRAEATRAERWAADVAVAQAVVGLPPSARKRRDPRQMVTAADVAAKRAELLANDDPSGERFIAKALGVSRSAVRYAEGKDHR